jgi:hypothetical protein
VNAGTLRGISGAEFGHVQNEGADVPIRPRLNLVGNGVDVADSSSSRRTDVYVDGALNLPTATGNGLFTPSAPASNTVLTDGSLFFQRIYVPRATTFTRFNCSVTTSAASSALRFGIYPDNAGGIGSLSVDLGTVSSTSTGIKSMNITQSLAAGFYWLAVCAQGGSPTLTYWTPIIPAQDISSSRTSVFPATAIWDSTGSWTSGALPSLPDSQTNITSCPRLVIGF